MAKKTSVTRKATKRKRLTLKKQAVKSGTKASESHKRGRERTRERSRLT